MIVLLVIVINVKKLYYRIILKLEIVSRWTIKEIVDVEICRGTR